MLKSAVLFLCCVGSVCVFGQLIETDTLKEVSVKAYGYDRDALDVPASVTVLDKTDLDRYSNTSLLPAVNTIPGVRMEERSPGSYRFSMRGSSLRSPFGVRNVKVYWNELPLTDAGGNTYLNQLDPGMIREVEVVKGPGSSLYGAGTGGVVLLNSDRAMQEGNQLDVSTGIGSFGLKQAGVKFKASHNGSNQVIHFSRQQSDGYRENTAMRRTVGGWTGTFDLSPKERIASTVFYSDLFYQIPGGLTEDQKNENPKQARAGAQTNGVSSHLRSFYSGVSHRWLFSESLENTTGIYLNTVRYENPFFTNYEHRAEMYAGGRSVTRYHHGNSTFNFGGELEYTYTPSRTYSINSGTPGALLRDDELSAGFYTLFGQWEYRLVPATQLTFGLSYNHLDYGFLRLSDSIPIHLERTYKPVLAPRLAILQKFTGWFSGYGSISEGFSPPSNAEVYSSDGVFNSTLKPEKGLNFELGAKTIVPGSHLSIDLTFYKFKLDETIVIRRDSISEPEYYTNAGRTDQNGIELSMIWKSNSSGVVAYSIGTSYTFNDYHYRDYVNESGDFSDKRIPGLPVNSIVIRSDMSTTWGVYSNLTLQHTDEIALNDANSIKARPYTLLGMKVGCHLLKYKNLNIYAGADNLLDQQYSLGNDLNAFKDRFFNPAATRNYYGGIIISFGGFPRG